MLLLASMLPLESPCPIGTSNTLSRWASFGLDFGPCLCAICAICRALRRLARTADLHAISMNSATFCKHGFLCLYVPYCLGICLAIPACPRLVSLCCRHVALGLLRLRLPLFACCDTCILQFLRCAFRVFFFALLCVLAPLLALVACLICVLLSMALRFDLSWCAVCSVCSHRIDALEEALVRTSTVFEA